jgi:hypothetical protein
MQAVNQAMLFAVQAAVVGLFGLNPLHFLWMMPLAFIFGAVSFVFPFSLLSILGSIYARLCCIGLDTDIGQEAATYDGDDISTFPHLYSALVGLPPWAMHLRTVNKLVVLVAVGVAVYFWVSEGMRFSVSYIIFFFLGYFAIALFGFLIARSGPLFLSIILGTVLLIAYQILLILHFFRVWSPFQ